MSTGERINNMESNFSNLAAAFSIFTEAYDLSYDQNLATLDSSIQQGYIDKAKLKEELAIAFSDPHFDWLNFAIETRLIVRDKEKYTSEGIKNYFKSLVWDYLNSAGVK